MFYNMFCRLLQEVAQKAPLRNRLRAIAGTAKGWPCATILPARQWSAWRTACQGRIINASRSASQFCELLKKIMPEALTSPGHPNEPYYL